MTYIVELEQGIFLANEGGKPTRTCLEETAIRYKNEKRAILDLAYARHLRSFPDAKLKIIGALGKTEVIDMRDECSAKDARIAELEAELRALKAEHKSCFRKWRKTATNLHAERDKVAQLREAGGKMLEASQSFEPQDWADATDALRELLVALDHVAGEAAGLYPSDSKGEQ
jgi:chromosome segregation ATPase